MSEDEDHSATEEAAKERGGEAFFCYELLTLSALSWDVSLRRRFRNSFTNQEFSGDNGAWFLDVALRRKSKRFAEFIERGFLDEDDDDSVGFAPGSGNGCSRGESLLASYLNSFCFTEFYLDDVFNYGEDSDLPRELFKYVPNLRILSLKSNYLEYIPPDIGRLQKLERLYLTNNKLENFQIPLSLIFCQSLKDLYVDNNLLDALPGFLLTMDSLRTVHRHGNHNYFKATFMWYHTDVHGRILEDLRYRRYQNTVMDQEGHRNCRKPESLQSICAKRIISTRIRFFQYPLPESLKDFIAGFYDLYNVCDNCPNAVCKSQPGYKVYTFKNPYLGNTCVPFLHWACSWDCARAIEIPARVEQQTAAQEQDRRYEDYIREAEAEIRSSTSFSSLSFHGSSKMSSSSLSSLCERRTPSQSSISPICVLL